MTNPLNQSTAAVRTALSDADFIAYCKGNVIDHLLRGNLAEADWYMRQLLMVAEQSATHYSSHQ
jgi:hypothetical protein